MSVFFMRFQILLVKSFTSSSRYNGSRLLTFQTLEKETNTELSKETKQALAFSEEIRKLDNPDKKLPKCSNIYLPNNE